MASANGKRLATSRGSVALFGLIFNLNGNHASEYNL